MDSQPQLPGIRTTREILDEHERATRTNWKNDGRGFQKEIETTAGGYHGRRIASLRKVDPPSRLVGGGQFRKVIFLANPFLDYVGAWTARGGKALFIEAKSTSNHRLRFGDGGGLTATQLSALKTWRYCGAATALLWQFEGRVALFTPEMLAVHEAAGEKSLVHGTGLPVPRGEGTIIWDFLRVLEATIWPANKC